MAASPAVDPADSYEPAPGPIKVARIGNQSKQNYSWYAARTAPTGRPPPSNVAAVIDSGID
jgi:hypothetical protein